MQTYVAAASSKIIQGGHLVRSFNPVSTAAMIERVLFTLKRDTT
jgi:hypothetical protein